MAKRVDPLKAKAAKQKKIAIGLSALLVLVLAYQGPKTLKMLKGPAAPEAVEAVPVPVGEPVQGGTPSAGAPTAPAGTPTAPTGTPSGADAQPAVLANSDIPVEPGDGQLLSFERFESKDPFQQQVTASPVDPTAPDANSQAGDGDAAAPGAEPVSPGTDPSIPGSAENPPISNGGGIGGSGSSGSGSSESPSEPTPPAVAAETTISVNGVVETVTVENPFPADQPTFELVSLARDGKSVQIGVAGGSLAGGAVTIKLTVGKSVTLQNTADGSRYKLQLLTVAGFAPPASKG